MPYPKRGGGFSGGKGGKKFGGKSFDRPSFGGGESREGGFGGGYKERGFQRRDDRPSFGGGQGGARPSMFQATCNECGNACEVPFKPNGSKPVYCNNCFGKKREGGERSFEKREYQGSARPSFGGDKPAYVQPDPSKNKYQFEEQFELLNAKLDTILRAMNSAPQKEPAPKKEETKEAVKKEKTASVKKAAKPAKAGKKKAAKK